LYKHAIEENIDETAWRLVDSRAGQNDPETMILDLPSKNVDVLFVPHR
jgi:hypothetical protein